MKRNRILLTFVAALCALCLQAQKKQNLKVLFVGGTPDFNTIGLVEKPDSIAVLESAKQRTAQWTAMLKRYFTTVKAIQGSDYSQSMSDKYDVTIFDGKPKAFRQVKDIRDADGRLLERIPAAYLTQDFNRPAVTIAEMGEDLGRSLGLKSDWYCLCLLGDAHSWKADHPVFKGPFTVNLKTFMDDTPAMAQEIATMFGSPLPKKTEMWKVQTKDYEKNTKMRIGMVSRPDGYGDPDDEVISSGRCAKSIDAVAIGRHGNFLHWGFAAAPDDMTEQAKQVFANCVVYISKHATRVIARKMDETITTRHWLGAKPYTDSRKGWEDNCRLNDEFYNVTDSIKAVARAKRAKGEKLSNEESIYVDFERPANTTFDEYMQERESELYPYLGTNTDLYVKYYEYNKPYFYPQGYDLKVDQKARELGIANNDKRLLEACISLLEKNNDDKQARQVLEHYTLCRFASAKEWRDWYETYKDKLFFSEGGGFLWLVNSQEANVPGNDYNVPGVSSDFKSDESVAADLKSADTSTPAPVIKGETDRNNPVLIEGVLNAATDGAKELVVRVKIHTGYHIYAKVSSQDPFINTEFKIELPDGMTADGPMKLPAAKPLTVASVAADLKSADTTTATTVYEGDCTFRQRIKGKGKGKVRCTVVYQCCDNTICLPPAEKTVEFDVK